MRFTKLRIEGPLLIEAEPIADERGFFARTFCEVELAAQGVNFRVRQGNVSHNAKKGTLRGMHFQRSPHEEAKIVTCLRGALYDVVVDLREGSPSRLSWLAVELREGALSSLYIPPGFAHGFQTLDDDTLVDYRMSELFAPGSGGGLRWDDPALGITWPDAASRTISDRDSSYPLLVSQHS